jgi:hypothetical protein
MPVLRRAVMVSLLSFNLIVASASAQNFGPDHLVVSPAFASWPIEVFAPVTVCYHTDPLAVIVDSAFQQSGDVITLTVHTNWSGICFAAGDPAVKKAVRLTMQPLPVGTYRLHYQRFNGTFQTDDESVMFQVAEGPAAIPSLTWFSLLILSVILLWIGLGFRRRVAP